MKTFISKAKNNLQPPYFPPPYSSWKPAALTNNAITAELLPEGTPWGSKLFILPTLKHYNSPGTSQRGLPVSMVCFADNTFYLLLWDQTDHKEPSLALVCSLWGLKSVKKNRANLQRVIVASVQVFSEHTQLIVQYLNHKGLKRRQDSLMANMMRWKTSLFLHPFSL